MAKDTSVSKYKNVNATSLKTSAESALKDITAIETSLKIVKSDLSNRAIVPNEVSRVALTALNFAMNSTQGEFSIGALKRYVTALKAIADDITTMQKKLKSYEKVLEDIKKESKKSDDDFSESRYRNLINQRNRMLVIIMNLESRIDVQVKRIGS